MDRRRRIQWTLWMAGCFFLLTAVAAAAPIAPIQIRQQTIQDERCTIWLPQLQGLPDAAVQERMNNEIARDINRERVEFLKAWEELQQLPQMPEGIKKAAHFWGTYAIKLNKNQLLSLTVQEYYYAGGAHGSTATWAYTMDTGSGKMLGLADIFKSGADYQGWLNEWIREEIRRNGKNHYYFEGVQDQQRFYLMEEGLVIFFQPYEIASWADGYIRFVIPYDQIRELLREDLPLY